MSLLLSKLLKRLLNSERFGWILALLFLIFPAICAADADKDLQNCRQSQDAHFRAACFKKLIPHIDDLSRETPGDTSWAEALKEAYEATEQSDKIPEVERRIQISAGAKKLLSNVLAETKSEDQAYTAVSQYYEAFGPDWQEAAKRAESLSTSKGSENGELPAAIKSQVAAAVNAAQPNVRTLSPSTPLMLGGEVDLQNKCIKASTVSDDSNASGRHTASVTVRNVCSQALTVYLCVKSDRAQCWTCKTIVLNSNHKAQGPTSIGFGDCTAGTRNGVQVVYNAATQGNPPKPSVDDSCQGKAR
jgi:hypothetical protein